MRIKKLSTFYFEGCESYLLGAALPLVFGDVFTFLFGTVSCAPPFFLSCLLMFLASTGFTAVFFWSSVLDIQMDRCTPFYFNSQCLQGFCNTWDRSLCMCPRDVLLQKAQHLNVSSLQSHLLDGSMPLQLSPDSCPVVFWKKRDVWMMNGSLPAHKSVHHTVERRPIFLQSNLSSYSRGRQWHRDDAKRNYVAKFSLFWTEDMGGKPSQYSIPIQSNCS